MKDIAVIKFYFAVFISGLGTIATYLVGGWDTSVQTLTIFLAIDFVLGLLVSGVFKKSKKNESGRLESHLGWKGVCKKFTTLIIVLVAYRLDVTLGIDFIKTGTVIGFITIETISIVENVGLMGIPLPKTIYKAIDVLNESEDKKNG